MGQKSWVRRNTYLDRVEARQIRAATRQDQLRVAKDAGADAKVPLFELVDLGERVCVPFVAFLAG